MPGALLLLYAALSVSELYTELWELRWHPGQMCSSYPRSLPYFSRSTWLHSRRSIAPAYLTYGCRYEPSPRNSTPWSQQKHVVLPIRGGRGSPCPPRVSGSLRISYDDIFEDAVGLSYSVVKSSK
ncbi:uncharacterized protein EV422DRAFT_329124 [Fimicolochytrium jonesii]|uniref:uncharacterized protein n=1 Tax=Fimicolochytrium jonesii TaxID=1396493 RepID=UPI0022FE9C30|nr:uncharacterized protein EV422DRAFT_329124 [Fimicolochytrium jonesii]KAI8816170.1 hypothetical protein EV422DRAFT_329124 [Fimicolochytrium jonesii]